MNDVVIRARDLRKVYRLYAKPSYRFRDMFGLLGNTNGAYTEHAALDGVNLEVRRGEKVAVIGRNGAGKSTFLKLVTGVIEPTSGALDVSARVHALLQIGTGFHPDFTGRENVYAYLAQLGVSGADATARCAEIVDFAELEEYIDQPIKTYSTGMAVRLMFAASTALTPDLLVLDEVLGVGDAYFAHKSYRRIRELCEKQGTTLLLVTHDVYSAIELCERVVWIDAGRILVDGDGPSVVKAYEDSIRQQEERRLRARKRQQLDAALPAKDAAPITRLLLELRGASGRPQPSPVYFSNVSLRLGEREISRWPIHDADAFERVNESHLQKEGGTWGEPVAWHDRQARAMLNYGASFHKVAGVFSVAGAMTRDDLRRLSCIVDFWSDEPCDVSVSLFANGEELSFGSLPSSAGEWVSHVASSTEKPAAAEGVNTSGIHGTGDIVVTDARFVDDAGSEVFLLAHGCTATLEVGYEIRRPDLREGAQVVIALHRDGVEDVCRFITRDLVFDGTAKPRGVIRLTIPRLTLTDGRYEVTILIAREGYYDATQTLFYTINPGVYFCVSRMFEISVKGAGLVGSGTVYLGNGDWSMK